MEVLLCRAGTEAGTEIETMEDAPYWLVFVCSPVSLPQGWHCQKAKRDESCAPFHSLPPLYLVQLMG